MWHSHSLEVSFPSLPSLSVKALTLGSSEDLEAEFPELNFDLEVEAEVDFGLLLD